MTDSVRGGIVPADEGQLMVFDGAERRMKVTSEQTEGHLTAFVSSYPVGVPHHLHVHHNAIESFFILNGAARFYIDGAIEEAEAGTFLSVPRGVVHGFVPIVEGTRALIMFTPSAMEGFWAELERATAAGTLDADYLQRLAREHGAEGVGQLPDEMLRP